MLKVVLTTFDNFYTINKQKLLSQLKSKFTKACKYYFGVGAATSKGRVKKTVHLSTFF